jgi:hypothetical protein
MQTHSARSQLNVLANDHIRTYAEILVPKLLSYCSDLSVHSTREKKDNKSSEHYVKPRSQADAVGFTSRVGRA